MNPEHREVFLLAFQRKRPPVRCRFARDSRLVTLRANHSSGSKARYNLAIPLVILTAFLIGLALIEWGLWPMYRPAAIAIGVLIAIGAPRVFAAVWRSHR